MKAQFLLYFKMDETYWRLANIRYPGFPEGLGSEVRPSHPDHRSAWESYCLVLSRMGALYWLCSSASWSHHLSFPQLMA